MWDYENTFSENQILTSGATSDNVVDVGRDDIGLGAPVYLQVALSGAPATELTIQVRTADDANLDGAAAVATFVVPAERVRKGGVALAAALPTGCKRYLDLKYTGPEGGKVTAGLVAGAQTSGMR